MNVKVSIDVGILLNFLINNLVLNSSVLECLRE